MNLLYKNPKNILLLLLLIVNVKSYAQDNNKIVNLKNWLQDTTVYMIVEDPPQFPGGSSKMIKYLRDNIRFDKSLLDGNDRVIVLVKFIVERDGSLTNITVNKGERIDLANEAKRLVYSMPKWKPGKQDNQIIRVTQYVNVIFDIKARPK